MKLAALTATRMPEHFLPLSRTSKGIQHSNSESSMTNLVARLTAGCLLSSLVLFVGLAGGQAVPALPDIKSQAELDKAVTALDAALFDSYNRCDLERFASFFVEDVEFYHDQGGVTLGRAALTDSVKKNICGRVTRELVPGSLQVYYMKGYGAVEMGVHRFHHPGHDDTEPVGEGRFVHLWQYKDGAWKITRVISYDHHAAAK
jgi:ketosteroid isomerase-like protein